MELLCLVDGRVRAVYAETIELRSLGRLAIARASHVEPDLQGQWRADLSPVDGPKLGPFARRSEALDAEAEWLTTHWLGLTLDR